MDCPKMVGLTNKHGHVLSFELGIIGTHVFIYICT